MPAGGGSHGHSHSSDEDDDEDMDGPSEADGDSWFTGGERRWVIRPLKAQAGTDYDMKRLFGSEPRPCCSWGRSCAQLAEEGRAVGVHSLFNQIFLTGDI